MKSDSQILQTRRKYDPAFKQDAVDRVIRTGKSIAEVARELGINSNMLARWRREHLTGADRLTENTQAMKPSDLAEQLRQARLEVDDLREQRDILKKALSIFSHRSPKGGK
jgi:transposase